MNSSYRISVLHHHEKTNIWFKERLKMPDPSTSKGLRNKGLAQKHLYGNKYKKKKRPKKNSPSQSNLNKMLLLPKKAEEESGDKLLPSLILQFPQFFCCPGSKGFCFVSLRSPSFS